MTTTQQPATEGVAIHLARPRTARQIPTFEERIQQQALADFRREQRKRRSGPSLARDFTYALEAGPSRRVNGYPCPELARPAGVTAERFIAFALPSRVGDWLHYPDGTKKRFPGK